MRWPDWLCLSAATIGAVFAIGPWWTLMAAGIAGAVWRILVRLSGSGGEG